MRRTIPLAIIAATSGALLALSYAPWDREGLAWVWAIPLLWCLWFTGLSSQAQPPKKHALRGALLGWISGTTFFLINLSWLHAVTPPGAILLALYLGLYFAAWGALAATIGRPSNTDLVPPGSSAPDDQESLRRPPLFAGSFQNLKFAFFNAAAWCALEWLRGILFTGFGWNGLGVALHQNLILVQIADIVGVTGLSFLLIFCASIATGTIRRIQLEFGNRAIRPHIDFGVTIIIVILVFFYGIRQLGRGYEDTIELRTLIVQPNIPIDEKWNLEAMTQNLNTLEELTSLFTETGEIDLVLWPETSLFYDFYHDLSQTFLNRVLENGDSHLLLGVEETAPPEEYYNSIALMRGSTREHQIHRKVHLVPFGEYLPFRNVFPPIEWIAGEKVPGDFNRGKSHTPLHIADPAIEIVPLICFEDTVGRHVRRFATPNPQLIVNVTNDGWFLKSAGARQHLANAKFRCIELKRPMARAANTGVSCMIDHVGSLFKRTGPPGQERIIIDHESGSHFTRGCLKDIIAIPRNPPLTFYARYGDLFSQIMLGFVSLTIILRTIRNRGEATTDS